MRNCFRVDNINLLRFEILYPDVVFCVLMNIPDRTFSFHPEFKFKYVSHPFQSISCQLLALTDIGFH